MTDIRRVAELAGVSLGTVSNVLNGPHLVAEHTRLRVEQAIAETGFVRNGSARQLRAGHSPLIGLIVLDVSNPFFTEVARGVEDAANAADSIVVICNSDDSAAKEQRYLQSLEEQRVQGMLITPVSSSEASVQRVRRRGIAVVLLDHPSRSTDLCSVAVDDVLGGELAATHLFAQGHRRIGFIHGPFTIGRLPSVSAAFCGRSSALVWIRKRRSSISPCLAKTPQRERPASTAPCQRAAPNRCLLRQ